MMTRDDIGRRSEPRLRWRLFQLQLLMRGDTAEYMAIVDELVRRRLAMRKLRLFTAAAPSSFVAPTVDSRWVRVTVYAAASIVLFIVTCVSILLVVPVTP